MVGLSFRPLHLKLYYLNIKMQKNSLQTLPTKGARSAEKAWDDIYICPLQREIMGRRAPDERHQATTWFER